LIGKGSQQKTSEIADPRRLPFALASTVSEVPSGKSDFSYMKRLMLRSSLLVDQTVGLIGHKLRFELAAGLAFNTAPVFLAVGITIYFSAPAEPLFVALLVTAVFFAALAISCEFHGRVYLALAIAAAIFTGMLVGKISVLRLHTPQIERQITTEIVGTILSVDRNRRGSYRLLLKPSEVAGIDQKNLPAKVRLSTTNRTLEFWPGMQVQGTARIQPVAGPVFPGSYDFSFFGLFSGLGGSGFFMGQPEISAAKPTLSINEQIMVAANSIRSSVRQRILNAMPGVAGDVAVALIVGDKTGIPQSIQQSLRNTGLAHILAISGLHIALVTLTVIWVIRAVFSLFPRIVLHYPIRKWAVCGAFAVATLYLVLSGAGIATQRAWIMISVMLFSVMLDRRAITIRSVAISAVLILVLNPQNLFAPGFQMSFAAVASLVAGYELLTKWQMNAGSNTSKAEPINPFRKMLIGICRYGSGLAITSLIAGTATAFISAWHFHQIAPFGLLTNLLAMPIVGFVIMPFALFSILLMPYGLEWIALVPVNIGIDAVIATSRWVEGISPAGVTGILPRYSLAMFGVFLATVTVFKTRLRLVSLIILPVLTFGTHRPETPQILVSENGRAVAVNDASGQLFLVYPRRNKFVTNIWAKAWAGGKIKPIQLPKDQCSKDRCIVVLPSSLVLHIDYNPDLLQAACQRADILIAPRLRWVNCYNRTPELILKRHDFEQYGSHAICIGPADAAYSRSISVSHGLPESTRSWSRNVRGYDTVNDIVE